MNSVDLEEKVCKALSLTGSKVKPENLGACHRKKKKAKVITKFKHRKKRNEVKKEDLLSLQFGQSLYINDSMCFKKGVLFNKCWQLKSLGKNFVYWLFNNTLLVKLNENGSILEIYRSCDLESLLQIMMNNFFLAFLFVYMYIYPLLR